MGSTSSDMFVTNRVQTKVQLLSRNLLQTLSVVRMGNVDDGARSLAQGLAVEIGNSVLRHDVADVRTRRHNASSLTEESDNLALSLLRRGGHGDDGLSALRSRSSVNEVDLSAEAGEDLGSDGVAHDLTRNIDLDRRVHRNHLRHLRDHEGVVREAHVANQHGRVVVHELVPTRHGKPPLKRLLRSHHEARRRAASVERLLPVTLSRHSYELVGDGARLDQIDHAVAEHLAVDAQTLVALQVRHHSVGNDADARLQRGAVLHQIVGDQLADLVLHLVHHCITRRSPNLPGSWYLGRSRSTYVTRSRWLMWTSVSP